MIRWLTGGILLSLFLSPPVSAQSLLPGFQQEPQSVEQVRWSRSDNGVRVFINAPAALKAPQRLLVLFATPNGNTIEQSLGCAASKDRDWRFDIQHVAAQVRRLREIDRSRDVVLAVVQSPKLSWPTFRREYPDSGTFIRSLVDSLRKEVAADRVALT